MRVLGVTRETHPNALLLLAAAALIAFGMAHPPLIPERWWRFVCWSGGAAIALYALERYDYLPSGFGFAVIVVLAVLLVGLAFVLESEREQRDERRAAKEIAALRALYAKGANAIRFHERVHLASAGQRHGPPGGPGLAWAQEVYEHVHRTRPERLPEFETEIEDALIDRPPRNIRINIDPERLTEDRIVEALRHKHRALADLIGDLSGHPPRPLAPPPPLPPPAIQAPEAWVAPPYEPPPEAFEAFALLEQLLGLRGLLAEWEEDERAQTLFPHGPTYKRLHRLLERAEDVVHRAPKERIALPDYTTGISNYKRAVPALRAAIRDLREIAAMKDPPGRFARIGELNESAETLLSVMADARRGIPTHGGLDGHRDRLVRWTTYMDDALRQAGADEVQLAYFNQETELTLHGPSDDENEQIGQFMDDLKVRRARAQEIVAELRGRDE